MQSQVRSQGDGQRAKETRFALLWPTGTACRAFCSETLPCLYRVLCHRDDWSTESSLVLLAKTKVYSAQFSLRFDRSRFRSGAVFRRSENWWKTQCQCSDRFVFCTIAEYVHCRVNTFSHKQTCLYRTVRFGGGGSFDPGATVPCWRHRTRTMRVAKRVIHLVGVGLLGLWEQLGESRHPSTLLKGVTKRVTRLVGVCLLG